MQNRRSRGARPRQTVRSLICAALWLISGACLSLPVRADIVDIDSAQLAKLSAAGVPVIDVRTAPEWQETGVVPGSHLLTFFDQQGRADADAWLKHARSVAKPGDPVILICRSGNRSRVVSELMTRQAGYAKVYNVTKGIRAWVQEGRPIAPAAPLLSACRANKTC